jgi:hypothetical protein
LGEGKTTTTVGLTQQALLDTARLGLASAIQSGFIFVFVAGLLAFACSFLFVDFRFGAQPAALPVPAAERAAERMVAEQAG